MTISQFQYAQMLAKLERCTPRSQKIPHSEVMKETRERGLHEEILLECSRRNWLCVHSRMDVPSTVSVGCSDFVVLADDGRTFLVEAKSRQGKLKPSQAAWLAWASKLGHKATVCRSLQEFVEFVDAKETSNPKLQCLPPTTDAPKT